MMFCGLFPDLFPGVGRDTPISGANLCPQNLLILRCIFSTLCCISPILCLDQPPRHVVDPAHFGQLGIQRLGQLPQLRPVPALPGIA